MPLTVLISAYQMGPTIHKLDLAIYLDLGVGGARKSKEPLAFFK